MLDDHFFLEQRDLQETIRDVLRDTLPPLHERDTGPAGRAAAADLRARLGAIGIHGIGFDERLGGVGGGLTELAVIARELGRALAPVSVVTSAVAAALLRAAGQSCEPVLRQLAAGVPVAVWLPQTGWAPWGQPQTRLRGLRVAADDLTVSGQLTGVVDLEGASWLVAHTGEEPAAGLPQLLVIDARDSGVRCDIANRTGVIRSFSRVSLDAVPAQGAPVAPGPARTAYAEGRLLLSYEMLGAAEAVIDLACEYARAREQFGRPIGSFQAVSHRLAAVYIEAQAAAAAACYALRGHDTAVFDLSARAAQAAAGSCLTACCDAAAQVFGAIAFTWEHPLHHFQKYAKTCDRLLSTERGLAAEIVSFLESGS